MIRVAQAGFGLAAIGMLGEMTLSQTIIGVVGASVVYVAGVALAIPSMISLYGDTAAPHRGNGMAVNGFVLFVGADIGAIVGGTIGAFGALTLTLAALLADASASLVVLESSAAPTSWPWASSRAPAAAGCPCPTTCPSSATTTRRSSP